MQKELKTRRVVASPYVFWGFPSGSAVKNPVFLPGESHGQRSLAGYSAWGRKE